MELTAAYLFIHGGKLLVGSKDDPFTHMAVITITGNRLAYELPVYGAKCIGVREGELQMHGKPKHTWTRLSATAFANNTHVDLRDPVDWEPNDLIVIASTSFDQEEAEPMRVAQVTRNGTRVELQSPLRFDHLGDGWSDAGPDTHSERGWLSNGDHIEEYSAEVGLLSHNVIVQGDNPTSRREQFGVQIVWHSRGDNTAVGKMSNVEVRFAGQGLKLGKYPIHFHLIGNVSRWEKKRKMKRDKAIA